MKNLISIVTLSLDEVKGRKILGEENNINCTSGKVAFEKTKQQPHLLRGHLLKCCQEGWSQNGVTL